VLQAFLRGLNHRPRRDRGGRSRADLHQDRYTPEQIDQARTELEQRYRKQRLAQQTLAARQNPETRRYLDEAFDRLGLTDPEGNVRQAIARYPLSAIVDGVAIFEAKLLAERIQPDDPARYLLGIVRRTAEDDDAIEIAEQLIDARLLARDALLAPLGAGRDAILHAQLSTDETARQLLIRGLETDVRLERLFWLRETACVIASAPRSEQSDLLHEAALRIQATHRISHRDRVDAFRYLADRAEPLA
jgi:predicted DNA-binding ribbon-helix-helix protein